MTDYRTEAQKDREARGMVLFNGQEITREAYDRIRGITPVVTIVPICPHFTNTQLEQMGGRCPECGA